MRTFSGKTLQSCFLEKKCRLMELRLIMRENKRLIRLRDNGMRFDPVKWLEINALENVEENLGKR